MAHLYLPGRKFYIVLIFLWHACSLEGYEFEAQGTTKYQIFALDGSISVQQEDIFSIQVKDCQWLITNTPTRFMKRGREQPLMAYWIASSDSTNFYQLTSLHGIIEKTNSRQGGPAFTGRIGPGSVPFGLSDPKLILLWYAFASTCYFDTLEDQYVNPPTVLIGEEKYAKDFRVAAFWDLQDSPPFLPKAIAFGEISKSDAPPQTGIRLKRLDFTNCVYKVEQVTTNVGLVLPKVLTFKYFARNPTNAIITLPTGTLTVVVTNFGSKVEAGAFTPLIPEPALLSDMRTISQKTPFGVAARNVREWPRLEESLKKAKAIGSRVEKPVSVHATSSATRMIIRVVLITSMVAPILGFGFWKWTRKRKQ